MARSHSVRKRARQRWAWRCACAAWSVCAGALCAQTPMRGSASIEIARSPLDAFALVRAGGALLAVLALIAGVGFALRRGWFAGLGWRAEMGVARGAKGVEILERTHVSHGAQLITVRFGAKVLLLAQTTGSARSEQRLTCVSELQDADEATRFVAVLTGGPRDDRPATRERPAMSRHEGASPRGNRHRSDPREPRAHGVVADGGAA
jgi:flagellar biogenesis protein FliO